MLPEGVLEAARHAYAGHRFETFSPGRHPRLWNVDMRAAYAWAALQIPDWPAGSWVDSTVPGTPALHHVSWNIPAGRPFGPFFWRYPPAGDRGGALCYPRRGINWVWSPELEVAERIWGAGSFKIKDTWSFVPGNTLRPWTPALDLLGRRGEFPPLKKILNAAWGKLAQSWPKPGPWLDPVSAGWLTSLVRSRMLVALDQLGGSTVAVLGDGLLVRKDPTRALFDSGAFEAGTEPGQLRVRHLQDCLVVSHALYFAGAGVATNSSDAHPFAGTRSVFEAAWDRDGSAATVEVHHRHQVGIAEALMAGGTSRKVAGIGQWTDAVHTVNFGSGDRIPGKIKITPAGGNYGVTKPPPAPDPLRILGAEARGVNLPDQVTLHSWPFWDADMQALSPPVKGWPGPEDEL
jgi:hypothetical protein